MCIPRFLLLIASVVLGFTLAAQQAVSPAGGDATGAGGSLAWTLGQIDPITIANSNGTVAQGVQQPVEFLILSAPGTTGVLSVMAVPNPAHNGISLQFDDLPGADTRYELLDVSGALLASGPITDRNTFIPLADKPSASYIIRIIPEQEAPTILRIVKQ